MIGVYFLFLGKKVVYIGATESWPTRLIGHKSLQFDSAKLLECPKSKLLEYEKRLISMFNPRQNVAHTSRQVNGRKDKTDWINKNLEKIAPLMEELESGKQYVKVRRKALPLLERMKKDLKYSPRTNAIDLLFPLKSAYDKLSLV